MYRYTLKAVHYYYNTAGPATAHSPGSIFKVALLLTAGVLNSDTLIAHRTVVPLSSDVAGTVRLDCTVPEDGSVTVVIPRASMSG